MMDDFMDEIVSFLAIDWAIGKGICASRRYHQEPKNYTGGSFRCRTCWSKQTGEGMTVQKVNKCLRGQFPGWVCTRPGPHNGPCALRKGRGPVAMVKRALPRSW